MKPAIAYCDKCGAVRVTRMASGGRRACGNCGRVEDLMPASSPRALETPGYVIQLATAAEELARQEAENRRRARVVAVAAVVCALLVVGGVVVATVRARFVPPPSPAAPVAQAAPSAVPRAPELPAVPSGHVRIAADGVAYASPSTDAEATWRVSAGETYKIAEERDGWVRLDVAAIAWVQQ